MENITSLRKNIRIAGDPNGDYVLYWMQINRRLHDNYALEYAVAWANKLKRPLIILEGLACDYPWATARTSTFMLEGMAEHSHRLEHDNEVTYIPCIEQHAGRYSELVRILCQRAAMLISDEYPVFIMRERNEQLEKELSIPFHTVDSSGIIPMALSEKAPYSAYIFRRMMQKHFLTCWLHPPDKNPLQTLQGHGSPDLPPNVRETQADGYRHLKSDATIGSLVRSLREPDHTIGPVAVKGTREAGLARLGDFISNDLMHYNDTRNDPDKEGTSRLSPWLHAGKISAFEVVNAAFGMQPDDWDVTAITPAGGKRDGFFGGAPSVVSFLDEVITWRETGFHFAWHTSGYDQFDSLPGWARETLSDHADDRRDHIYTMDELAASQTHDPVWNAAQTQLREEGRIHNYLRMLWGKKVLEWTPDPQTALEYLIDLNNTYAIDGRDPNSYSGIFWIFGRFDRAWGPERPIFGKVRYMSSDSARKKINMENYLKRYSGLSGI